MKTYRYKYLGSETVHLPEHGILAKGGDVNAVYETDKPINYPDFEEIKEIKKEKE